MRIELTNQFYVILNAICALVVLTNQFYVTCAPVYMYLEKWLVFLPILGVPYVFKLNSLKCKNIFSRYAVKGELF